MATITQIWLYISSIYSRQTELEFLQFHLMSAFLQCVWDTAVGWEENVLLKKTRQVCTLTLWWTWFKIIKLVIDLNPSIPCICGVNIPPTFIILQFPYWWALLQPLYGHTVCFLGTKLLHLPPSYHIQSEGWVPYHHPRDSNLEAVSRCHINQEMLEFICVLPDPWLSRSELLPTLPILTRPITQPECSWGSTPGG